MGGTIFEKGGSWSQRQVFRLGGGQLAFCLCNFCDDCCQLGKVLEFWWEGDVLDIISIKWFLGLRV